MRSEGWRRRSRRRSGRWTRKSGAEQSRAKQSEVRCSGRAVLKEFLFKAGERGGEVSTNTKKQVVKRGTRRNE